jgi:uroporphyrinogen decarboxylase
MTSKERVLATLAYGKADRTPVNYSANSGIDKRLKAYFGLAANDDEGLRLALSIDYRNVIVPYCGKKLHADIPERGVKVDNWGIHTRWIEHQTGGYWDYCDFPLKDADLETVANWPMPNPDDFDYSQIRKDCEKHSKYCVTVGGSGIPDIINSTGMIRSMEQVLIDLALDDPAGFKFIDRRIDIFYEIITRTLEAAKGGIDLLLLGEDLGTQIGPLISLEMFRKHFRPRHQKFIDIGKHFGIPVQIHSCGSSSWAFEDFIEMGITAVDTLQPEAKNMSPKYLKKSFSDRLVFHGCISTAGPVATGTVEDTIDYCRQTLEIMMTGGGYCFSPTHALQDNSPTENVVAMYETAKKYGKY